MSVKIISNKDGFHSNGVRSFTSYSPSSYRVEVDGLVVGIIEQVQNFHLSNINREWSGRSPAWLYVPYAQGETQIADQYLCNVRSAIKRRYAIAA